MLCLGSFLWIQRSKKNSTEGSRMLFTGEIDSEFVSKHEFGNEWLPSTSDPYFEFTIAKFSFTSTGRDFDSNVL